jgi:hypothetical protein
MPPIKRRRMDMIFKDSENLSLSAKRLTVSPITDAADRGNSLGLLTREIIPHAAD